MFYMFQMPGKSFRSTFVFILSNLLEMYCGRKFLSGWKLNSMQRLHLNQKSIEMNSLAKIPCSLFLTYMCVALEHSVAKDFFFLNATTNGLSCSSPG